MLSQVSLQPPASQTCGPLADTLNPQRYATNDTVKVLLITVFQSIIEVVILCAAGYILARAGILDKPTQRKLNVVNGESWPDHIIEMPLG